MLLLKSIILWSSIFIGLFHMNCDARAVNVSNTWTMPQEGLNVFYRFFRDRISWFEADAVCQFHHANLVTVDNSFQFDATRDLLRELDVNDIVWIGLIRPQSSERFMWSNSRPLIANTGYWAESLPLMEAPLCAVIDPIRDYRWHALRCGGPETASFLCEMAVPTWADACILKDIPNLTMQYMADTASVELIRTCQDEGTLRQTCKGKQDRERIIRELVCPRERMETQRINDITNSHFKSLKIINSVHTDNNENNDIELVPINIANYGPSSELSDPAQPTEKNTVQRLIEQFNVDELMQADQPADTVLTGFKIPYEIPKPVKKFAKKYSAENKYQKKEQAAKLAQKDVDKKYMQPEVLALEDMMMGDQPQGEPELVEHALEDEVSNEIMEPLPHRKKILPQDLKTMPSFTETQLDSREKQNSKVFTTLSPKAEKTIVDQAQAPLTTFYSNTGTATTIYPEDSAGIYTEVTPTTTTTTVKTIAETSTHQFEPAIGHPIHPPQTHGSAMSEDLQHAHMKETVMDNSHFIPPMLMVKSHYVPPGKHEHEHEHIEHASPIEHPEHHVHLHAMPTTAESIVSTAIPLTTTTTAMATEAETTTATVLIMNEKMPKTKTEPNEISLKTTEAFSTVPTTTSIMPSTSTTTTTTATPIEIQTTADKHKIETTTIEEQSELAIKIATTMVASEPTTTEINKVLVLTDGEQKATVLDDMPTSKSSNLFTTTTDEAIKSVEILPSTEMPELLKSVIKTINNKRSVVQSTTTTRTTMPTDTSVDAMPEEERETVEEDRYERMFASKTTPDKAKEFEAKVAAAFAYASKLGQEPLVPLDVRTTAASVATTTTTTTATVPTTIPTISAATQTETSVATTLANMPQSQEEEEMAKTADQIVLKTNVSALQTLEQEKIQTTQTPTQTTTTTTTTTIDELKTDKEELIDDLATTRHNFLSDETTTTYKPNRHRLLTKPESVSYFKKILG